MLVSYLKVVFKFFLWGLGRITDRFTQIIQ